MTWITGAEALVDGAYPFMETHLKENAAKLLGLSPVGTPAPGA
jgi:hypothetical protein